MGPRLPFRLKVPKRDTIDGAGVTSTVLQVHGYLHVDGDRLVVQWGGTAKVTEVGAAGVRNEAEPLPNELLEVPVADLHRAELMGGWFRPRLTVQARTVGILATVPTEEFGVVNFWYERSERFTAIAVAQELTDAIAAVGGS